MSAQAESEPFEVLPSNPDSPLGHMLLEVQREGYPAFLGWTAPLSENSHGYVVQAPGTRRVITIVECLETESSRWLAQTFRVRRDADDPAAFEAVCQEMLTETKAYTADQRDIMDMLHNLFLGKGMDLQYPEVILECNAPPSIISSGDAHRTSFSPASVGQFEPGHITTDMAAMVQTAFENDTSSDAPLAIDIGLHLANSGRKMDFSNETLTVYRTRFQNYPWASDAEGPLFYDFVLLKVNDGSLWYTGAIKFDEEINPLNISRFKIYGNQIMMLDVPGVVAEEISGRIRNARAESATPSYLMVDQLKRRQDQELEEQRAAANPYNFLDESF